MERRFRDFGLFPSSNEVASQHTTLTLFMRRHAPTRVRFARPREEQEFLK